MTCIEYMNAQQKSKYSVTGQAKRMKTKVLIDRTFKEHGVKFELAEFENSGKPIHVIISINPKPSTTGDSDKFIISGAR